MSLKIQTEKEFDLEDLQYEIEESRKSDRWLDAPADVKELFHLLEWNIIDGEHHETVRFINQCLEREISPRTLVAGPMATGIAEVGRRDTPGRPVLFGTTFTFLERFGLTSLDGLPPLTSEAAAVAALADAERPDPGTPTAQAEASAPDAG